MSSGCPGSQVTGRGRVGGLSQLVGEGSTHLVPDLGWRMVSRGE